MPGAGELLVRLWTGEVTRGVGDVPCPRFAPLTHVVEEMLALTTQWPERRGQQAHPGRRGCRAHPAQVRCRPPKPDGGPELHLVDLCWTGRCTVSETGELSDVSRSPVHCAARVPTCVVAGAPQGR